MFHRIRISSRCGFAVVLCLFLASNASRTTSAQVTPEYWEAGSGGTYGAGGDWSLGMPGSYPVFDLNTSGYTVIFTGQYSAIDTVIETDNPTFLLAGGPFTNDYLDVSDVAGTNGSLTLERGTFYENLSASYINVGNGSNAAQLIVNGATVNQQGLDTTIGVASGSTLTVENGGSVTQTDLGGQTMGVANLVVNDGTVSTQGTMNLGSATITNGSTVNAGASSFIGTLNVTGNVAVDDSSFGGGNAYFSPTSSLTLTDNAEVSLESGNNITLDGSVDVISGQIQAVAQTEDLDAALTIQLNANMADPTNAALRCHFIIEGGSLTVTVPNGFTPTIGEQFQLFYNLATNPLTGTFSSVTLPALPSGESWNTTQLYSSGLISIVPEPTAIGLMLGAGGLLLCRRRKPVNASRT
jgi:hypothetical protein